jgi:hypothetical protein
MKPSGSSPEGFIRRFVFPFATDTALSEKKIID